MLVYKDNYRFYLLTVVLIPNDEGPPSLLLGALNNSDHKVNHHQVLPPVGITDHYKWVTPELVDPQQASSNLREHMQRKIRHNQPFFHFFVAVIFYCFIIRIFLFH